jgi:processive 1,2-diacylglycerol beta-glucosyltransferase
MYYSPHPVYYLQEDNFMARILILHASVGTGHKSAGQALEKALNLRQAGQVWCEDALDYGSKVFRNLYVGSYLELSEKIPELWALFYERSDKDENELTKDLRTLLDRIGVTQLNELIAERRPDAIICTHILPLNLVAREQRKGRISCPLYCVVTDYTAHVFWAAPEVDAYFVPNIESKEMLIKRGVAEAVISITGIPINPAITAAKNPTQIRQDRQITQTPVITLMGGGLDPKKVRLMVIGLLNRPLNGTLFVVAGRNKELHKALQGLQSSPTLQLQVLDYIDYVDDLVVASDVVITKAGGLIVSEVLARHTPMVIVDPIPGQEEWNADHIVSVGAGVQVRLAEMVPPVVENLLHAPARLALLRAGAKQAGRPEAAFTVAEAVLHKIQS